MNQKIFNKIVKLNNDFYNKIKNEFDKTRLSQWNGWNRVGEIIAQNFKDQKVISILDVACGNGRFVKAVTPVKKGLPLFKYLGIDTNDYLLDKARKNSKENKCIEFRNIDVINDLESLSPETFDIVVAFGITHHIPSKEFRKKWFLDLSKLVSKNGLLIFTIWNYQTDERFEPAGDLGKNIKSDIKLEEGDYFLGWGNNKEAKRYFHKYSDAEILGIEEILCSAGLNQISKFKSDGKNGKLNEYFVYKRS